MNPLSPTRSRPLSPIFRPSGKPSGRGGRSPPSYQTSLHAGGVEMPACKLVWYDGGLRPPRPDGLPEGRKMGDNGRLLVGDKGFIRGTGRDGDGVYPASCAKDAADVARTIPRSENHYQEWIDACKGGKPGGSNFDLAGPLAESV